MAMVWGFFHEVGRKIIHITILIVLAAYFFIQDSLVAAGYTAVLAKQVCTFLVSFDKNLVALPGSTLSSYSSKGMPKIFAARQVGIQIKPPKLTTFFGLS